VNPILSSKCKALVLLHNASARTSDNVLMHLMSLFKLFLFFSWNFISNVFYYHDLCFALHLIRLFYLRNNRLKFRKHYNRIETRAGRGVSGYVLGDSIASSFVGQLPKTSIKRYLISNTGKVDRVG
jgi:hypothetical protein